MARMIAIGLTALVLAACGPADQTPTAETAAPAPSPAPVSSEPAKAPQTAAMSWEAMQERYQQIEVEPTDPLEALEYRAVTCAYLSSEIGGDVPEREQFLYAQIDKYRCEDALVAELRAMRDARADEPAVVARLDTILANLY